MDIVPYVAAAQGYLAAHPGVDTAIGFFVGAIGTHPAQCADLAFAAIAKTPLKGPVVRRWPAFKAWLDAVEERFSLDVAEAAKASPAAPQAAVQALPAPVAADAPKAAP